MLYSYLETGERKLVIVEIIRPTRRKPYLGGYRHRITSVEYHHASAQTNRPSIPDVSETKESRDTQVCKDFFPLKFDVKVVAMLNEYSYSERLFFENCTAKQIWNFFEFWHQFRQIFWHQFWILFGQEIMIQIIFLSVALSELETNCVKIVPND